jgi:hypothetical protein
MPATLLFLHKKHFRERRVRGETYSKTAISVTKNICEYLPNNVNGSPSIRKEYMVIRVKLNGIAIELDGFIVFLGCKGLVA